MQLNSTAGIGLVLAGAICGVAQVAPDDADSVWLAQPSFEDQARAYPHEAHRKHVSGETAIRCSVKPDGGLADCLVASETPAGMGFGTASLSLADRFRMKPEAVGKSAHTVTVPFRWMLAETDWQSLPNGQQIAADYPNKARAWNVNGQVRLRCRVKADGTLSDCFTLFEAPEGYGFGRATLDAAQYFRMKPTTPDGKSVEGGMVDIPIRWHLGDVPFTPVFEVGDGTLLVTYLNPGEQPTRSKNPVSACASPDDRGRRCEGHPIGWRDRPSNAAVWQLISRARVGDRETLLSCAAGDDGALHDCRVTGNATPQEEAAMSELAKDMKLAPEAQDGVPVQRGRITLFFDWPRLKFVTMPASERRGL
jgi:TonB family protein